MMQQYLKVKEQYPNTLLFYRLGDFYEMFFDDAKTASKELDLTLTGRDCGEAERAPMCGVPFHAADTYIARLVAKGYKVAVCEQMEDPATAKGIVKRDVIRVMTPGTVIESSMLDESRNNYLAAVFLKEERAGLAFADISTGAVHVCARYGKNITEQVKNEIARFEPSEMILNTYAVADQRLREFLAARDILTPDKADDSLFDYEAGKLLVTRHFKKSEDELSLGGIPEAVMALGAALSYLKTSQKSDLENITELQVYDNDKYMGLDVTARRNLELTESAQRREKRGSLLWVVDKTKTSMGKRLIRSYVENPLVDVVRINERLNCVKELYSSSELLTAVRDALAGINDFERILTRIVYGTCNARELRALAAAAAAIPQVKALLSGARTKLLREIDNDLDELADIYALIDAAIADEPAFSVREGGMIQTGYNEELDSLREITTGGTKLLAELEAREKEQTGIKKLKVGYNKVFGYYIEVSNSFKELVPDHYIRKQTLVNGERFITEELKTFEAKVLGAQERINKLEYELFREVTAAVAKEQGRIKRTASALARLDTFASFAYVSLQYGYEMPTVNDSDKIIIKNGRHPVVEKFLGGEPFVHNDTAMDCGENRTQIITGPNMAGKSTYMRQIALIVIMAQMGCFVPAYAAEIGIVDKIFTRIGASDDLSMGQSTFMMEMSEVSAILKNATKQSLIILDEIGRGTSTYDGMSIARAVLEYVTDKKKLGAKTLFATHYHELTALENTMDGVKNYNIAVKKRGEDIIFLRKIVPGGADGSYGIEVAKLAGIPAKVVARARTVLAELEAGGGAPVVVRQARPAAADEMQISMTAGIGNEIMDELKRTDLNTLTPIEALTMLYRLKKLAES
ncbi:MAG: DNA mismatch repair protein MutS [Clostridia bacterium]|nr:DNA mismatch repair protein MutS [Clostridia bacterium]